MEQHDSDALSLQQHCEVCEFQCCENGGSPLITEKDRATILEAYGPSFDFFEPLGKSDSGDGTYFIGWKQDAQGQRVRRDLKRDPCPFHDKNPSRCRIQDYKPLDCRLYPLKPFLGSDSDGIDVAVDGRCPVTAASEIFDFIRLANPVIPDLSEHVEDHPDEVREYLGEINTWPLGEDSSTLQEFIFERAEKVEFLLPVVVGENSLADEVVAFEEAVKSPGAVSDASRVCAKCSRERDPSWGRYCSSACAATPPFPTGFLSLDVLEASAKEVIPEESAPLNLSQLYGWVDKLKPDLDEARMLLPAAPKSLYSQEDRQARNDSLEASSERLLLSVSRYQHVKTLLSTNVRADVDLERRTSQGNWKNLLEPQLVALAELEGEDRSDRLLGAIIPLRDLLLQDALAFRIKCENDTTWWTVFYDHNADHGAVGIAAPPMSDSGQLDRRQLVINHEHQFLLVKARAGEEPESGISLVRSAMKWLRRTESESNWEHLLGAATLDHTPGDGRRQHLLLRGPARFGENVNMNEGLLNALLKRWEDDNRQHPRLQCSEGGGRCSAVRRDLTNFAEGEIFYPIGLGGDTDLLGHYDIQRSGMSLRLRVFGQSLRAVKDGLSNCYCGCCLEVPWSRSCRNNALRGNALRSPDQSCHSRVVGSDPYFLPLCQCAKNSLSEGGTGQKDWITMHWRNGL